MGKEKKRNVVPKLNKYIFREGINWIHLTSGFKII